MCAFNFNVRIINIELTTQVVTHMRNVRRKSAFNSDINTTYSRTTMARTALGP